MHQALRLRTPHIKHRARPPQNLQNMRIALRHSSHPSHEAPIPIQTLHANVFLDANWEAMEGPERLLVFCEVGIEGGGAVEGALGEELGDAVCLRIMSFIDAGDRQTVGREGR
jgi:hypothetical protein